MKSPGCSLSFDGIFVLTCVLVVLKATGQIAWSWWWVFAPLWIGALLFLLAIFAFCAIGVLIAWYEVATGR